MTQAVESFEKQIPENNTKPDLFGFAYLTTSGEEENILARSSAFESHKRLSTIADGKSFYEYGKGDLMAEDIREGTVGSSLEFQAN